MASIAKYVYPQIVWQNREKKVWNPIQKKALKNLPEERVRLRMMEALIRAGWSKHRISTEEAIGELGNKALRTDLICYSQQFDPQLLVECKAEYISISAKTAKQVARYNQKVGAPYLLMSNGVSDFWYGIDRDLDSIQKIEASPDFLEVPGQHPDYRFDDWKARGFAGEKAPPELRRWHEELLPKLWFGDNIQFLTFSDGPSDVDLNHYYRIESISEHRRLAITTINTAFGGNRMIVILNEENENKAVLEINLDVLFADKKGNSSVYSRAGIKTFDLGKYLDLPSLNTVDELIKSVNGLFANQVE